tara:strand:+ start:197200 stop:197472 length:273 start_codon:yes stop_codon:yes gene_type:complete
MSDLINSGLDDDMKNSWGTDPDVFNALDREFDFSLDAAASDENHLVYNYLTKEDDALSANWEKVIKVMSVSVEPKKLERMGKPSIRQRLY